MKTYNKPNMLQFLVLLMLLSITTAGCSSLRMTNDDSDSGGEGERRLERVQKIERDKNREREQALREVDNKMQQKLRLGEENVHLQEKIADNKQEVSKVLQEMQDDVNHDRDLVNRGSISCTHAVTCKVCKTKEELTFGKFMEIARRYNISYTQYEAYLGWEAACHGNVLSFDKCHRCMTADNVRNFEQMIQDNKTEIAKLEADILNHRVAADRCAKECDQQRESVADLAGEINKKQYERQRRKQAEEARKQAEEREKQAEEARKQAEERAKQAEEAKKQAEEARKQEEERVTKMARALLASGMPREEIMNMTGLNEEDFRHIDEILSTDDK